MPDADFRRRSLRRHEPSAAPERATRQSAAARMITASLALRAHPQRPWRAALAVLIGNTLGWFDLAIYGFFAVTMANVFFPTDSETASVLLALGTFGITFVT